MGRGRTQMEKMLLELETQMGFFDRYGHQRGGAGEEEDEAASTLRAAEVFHRAQHAWRKLHFLRKMLKAEVSSSGGSREGSDRLRQVAVRVDALEEALARWDGSTTTTLLDETGSGGGDGDGGVGDFSPCDCTNTCFEEGFAEDAVEREDEDAGTGDDESRPGADDACPSPPSPPPSPPPLPPCNAGMEEGTVSVEEEKNNKERQGGLCLCFNKACMVLFVAVAGTIAVANIFMGDEVEFLVPT